MEETNSYIYIFLSVKKQSLELKIFSAIMGKKLYTQVPKN